MVTTPVLTGYWIGMILQAFKAQHQRSQDAMFKVVLAGATQLSYRIAVQVVQRATKKKRRKIEIQYMIFPWYL